MEPTDDSAELPLPETGSVDGLLLVNNSGAVYRTDVISNETTLLADYSQTFTDIAITPTGAVYANTFGALYELNIEDETLTSLGMLSGSANGLATDAEGRLYISYFGANRIDVVDPETVGSTMIEMERSIALPTGVSSAGDMHIVDGIMFYATTGRQVLTIDPDTGEILGQATHPLGALYGLHYTDQLYGYSGNRAYSIDPATGGTVELAELDMEGSVYGAATAPSRTVVGTSGDDTLFARFGGLAVEGYGGDDTIFGSDGTDEMDGGAGDDTLMGYDGDDILRAGDGTDVVNGGDGADDIRGGDTAADRRDEIYGGEGDDVIDAGYGNDLVYGMGGNDTIAGGFGADELQGQDGDDVLTGSALSDLVYGGAGDDFVNGGFGFDRINGGAGADRFYHLGIADHGSDWVQDYTAADGDVLLFGQTTASADDFVVRFAHTASDTGERSGNDTVEEAFVNYQGRTVWALVDGGGQTSINLDIDGEVFDLLA